MRTVLSHLVKPAAALLGRLRFTRKLLLIALVFVVPMLSLSGLLLRSLSTHIDLGESEVRGIRALKDLIELQNAVQGHRGVMALRFSRSGSTAADAARVVTAADAAIAALDRWGAGDGRDFDLDEQWQAIKQGWAGLKVRTADDTAERNLQNHTAVVEKIIAYTGSVAVASTLTLDPETASHALVDFTTEKAPVALASVGLLRNFASTHFSPGEPATPLALTRLLAYESSAHAAFIPLQASMQRALRTDASAADLSDQLDGAVATEDTLRRAIDEDVTNPGTVDMNVRELFAMGSAAKNALIQVDKSAMVELERLVRLRISRARHQRMVTLGVGLATLGVWLYLYFGFMDSFSTALYQLRRAATSIAGNEFPERIDLHSNDEMQEIADDMARISRAFRSYSDEQKHQLAEAVRRDAELEALNENLQRALALQTAILDSSSLGIIATDRTGVVASFNRAAQRMLGYPAEEVVGRKALDEFHDRGELTIHSQRLGEHLGQPVPPGIETLTAKARASADGVDEQEWTYVRKDGSRLPVLLSVTGVRNRSGALNGFLGVAQDITERKQRDLAIARSLKEKETLLKEVYHRVKNNLQVITSLFDLQLRNVPPGPAYAALRDGADRVRAMALVHEKLYQSGTLSSISVKAYIEDLCERLGEAANIQRRGIGLVTEIQPVEVGMDTAIPLGLWLNEVISNSLKHGFQDGRPGTIRVTLVCDADGLLVTVADDGVGIAPDAPRKSKSLGMKLVASLSEQLDGSYTIESANGVCVRLRFPLPGA
ncbi:MAG: histidine kinase dimerization/phosphoacceptor domain -containing protein [Nevskia sp.]|nr:histidine kinase dimerization/phosphoacceptor domain -containing protein [Nevskia sp.]